MRHFLPLLLVSLLAACAQARFDPAGPSDAAYEAEHPTFAEYCAVSQIKKRPGFGADIRGNIGGHAVFFLQGACKDETAGYPVLRACDGGGAGLSMNEHFRNAKWVATPGDAFFFEGGLRPGEALTPARYQAALREARRLGIYDGVTFHDRFVKMAGPGWDPEDWKYELSAGTDYAIAFGRGRHCVRIPVDRAGIARMIDFLNAENAPYRAGKVFEWDLFADNCIHLAHNALAAAGLWAPWPTHRPLLVSIFDFPVPRNELVNLVLHTNAALPADPGAAYRDPVARRSLLLTGELPTRPGALALSRGLHEPNALYEDGLALIFYDEPNFGHYQSDSDRIFASPRFLDPVANRAWFQAQAQTRLRERAALSDWLQRPEFAADPAGFTAVYDRFYALMARLAQSPVAARS